jgi:hypothetical protein
MRNHSSFHASSNTPSWFFHLQAQLCVFTSSLQLISPISDPKLLLSTEFIPFPTLTHSNARRAQEWIGFNNNNDIAFGRTLQISPNRVANIAHWQLAPSNSTSKLTPYSSTLTLQPCPGCPLGTAHYKRKDCSFPCTLQINLNSCLHIADGPKRVYSKDGTVSSFRSSYYQYRDILFRHIHDITPEYHTPITHPRLSPSAIETCFHDSNIKELLTSHRDMLTDLFSETHYNIFIDGSYKVNDLPYACSSSFIFADSISDSILFECYFASTLLAFCTES